MNLQGFHVPYRSASLRGAAEKERQIHLPAVFPTSEHKTQPEVSVYNKRVTYY